MKFAQLLHADASRPRSPSACCLRTVQTALQSLHVCAQRAALASSGDFTYCQAARLDMRSKVLPGVESAAAACLSLLGPWPISSCSNPSPDKPASSRSRDDRRRGSLRTRHALHVEQHSLSSMSDTAATQSCLFVTHSACCTTIAQLHFRVTGLSPLPSYIFRVVCTKSGCFELQVWETCAVRGAVRGEI